MIQYDMYGTRVVSNYILIWNISVNIINGDIKIDVKKMYILISDKLPSQNFTCIQKYEYEFTNLNWKSKYFTSVKLQWQQ